MNNNEIILNNSLDLMKNGVLAGSGFFSLLLMVKKSNYLKQFTLTQHEKN